MSHIDQSAEPSYLPAGSICYPTTAVNDPVSVECFTIQAPTASQALRIAADWLEDGYALIAIVAPPEAEYGYLQVIAEKANQDCCSAWEKKNRGAALTKETSVAALEEKGFGDDA